MVDDDGLNVLDGRPCRAKMSQPRRDEIFGVALDLFMTNGFHATSMEAIASAAKASKETLYRHFGNKEALLLRSVEEVASRITASAGRPDADSPRGALTAFGSELAALLGDDRVIGIYRVLAAEAVRAPHLARLFEDAGPRKGRAVLTALIARFASEGRLAVDGAERAAEVFSALIFGPRFREIIIGLLPPADAAEQKRLVTQAVESFCRIYPDQPDAPDF
jgi:TetR/AcrR family transcriptional repressor of mexJK operon